MSDFISQNIINYEQIQAQYQVSLTDNDKKFIYECLMDIINKKKEAKDDSNRGKKD